MPKPKPDQVIRHEICLGAPERRYLDDAKTAYVFNRAISPLTNMSASGYLALGAIVLLLIDRVLGEMGLDPNWREITKEMTPEQVNDWLETQNLVVGGTLALLVALSGGSLLAVGGAGILGGVAVETAEEADARMKENTKQWAKSLIEAKNSITRTEGWRRWNPWSGTFEPEEG